MHFRADENMIDSSRKFLTKLAHFGEYSFYSSLNSWFFWRYKFSIVMRNTKYLVIFIQRVTHVKSNFAPGQHVQGGNSGTLRVGVFHPFCQWTKIASGLIIWWNKLIYAYVWCGIIVQTLCLFWSLSSWIGWHVGNILTRNLSILSCYSSRK